MASEFDKYAIRGNEVLYSLMKDLRIPLDKASRILRAVLHTIRNHVSVVTSVQILARLPMALKGIYVDKWDIAQNTIRVHHVNQFMDEIRSYDKEPAGNDFVNDGSSAQAVTAVFRSLRYYLSDGEFQDIIALLPREIKEFVRGSIGLNSVIPGKATDHTHTLP